jgi:hypothetical protein
MNTCGPGPAPRTAAIELTRLVREAMCRKPKYLSILLSMILLVSCHKLYAADQPLSESFLTEFAQYYNSNATPSKRGWKSMIYLKYDGPADLLLPINNIVSLFAAVTVGLQTADLKGNMVVIVFSPSNEISLRDRLTSLTISPIKINDTELQSFVNSSRPCGLFLNISGEFTSEAVLVVRSNISNAHKVACVYELVRESFGFKPIKAIQETHKQIMFDQLAIFSIFTQASKP